MKKKHQASQSPILENLLDFPTLKKFFDDAAIGIAVVNEKNKLISCNNALKKMLGYAKKELETFTTKDLTAPEDYEKEKQIFEREIIKKGRSTYRLEKRIKHKKGKYIWVSVTASVVRNKKGLIAYGIGIIEDISERKRIEKNLLKSEERFRVVTEMVSDYAYSYQVKKDGRLKREWITEAAYRITGYTIEELMGEKKWTEIVADEDVALSKQKLQETLDGNPVEYDVKIRTKQGEIRDVRDHTFPIWDGKKRRIVHLYGAVTDVTESKKLERQLRESRAFIQQILDATPNLIYIQNVQTGVNYYCNPECERFYGYSADEIQKRGANFFKTVLHPDDLSRIQPYLDFWLTARDGDVWESDVRMKNASGQYRWLRTRDTIFKRDDKGGVELILGVAVDVTERREAREKLLESERRFRLLIQNSSDITAIMNSNGVLTYLSASIQHVLGYSPEELIDKNAFENVHPDDLERACAVFENVIRQIPQHRFECRYKNKKGEWKFIEVNVNRAFEEPTIHGIILNVRDITERKQVEQQLLQSQKMEAIGSLAGGMAHDFNNIMTSILVAAQLVKESASHERTIERMQMIERAVKRGKGIVENLLFFAREKTPEMKPISCMSIIAQIAEMIEHSFPSNISVEVYGHEDSMIMGDIDQLYQVLLNLAINARDAMPNGGTLTFKTDILPPLNGEGQLVRVQVSDTGTGIPKEVQTRIFEPFYTTKEVGKGTGLGLAIVHGVMKSHQGKIELESIIDKGTTFSLYFPYLSNALSLLF